jgi:hypothetical protein
MTETETALNELLDCLKTINDPDQTKEVWGPRLEAAYKRGREVLVGKTLRDADHGED